MSGSGKQTTKGKENVKCKECDKIIRKDEMTKHWENFLKIKIDELKNLKS